MASSQADRMPEDAVSVPRPNKTIAVHTVAWLLVAVAVYDGAGYAFGGDQVASSPSFAALASVPGGMRTWGFFLLAGAVAVAWGIGRDSAGHPRALNIVLAVGVGYCLFWAGAIPWTWFQLGYIPAWGAVSKPAILAALYYLCARAAAPHAPTWVDKLLRLLTPARSNRERG